MLIEHVEHERCGTAILLLFLIYAFFKYTLFQATGVLIPNISGLIYKTRLLTS